MNIEIRVTGTSPLLMHNPLMVDPDFEPNIEIRKLTSKKSKTKADRDMISRLEWFGGLYTEENGNGLVIVQPTSKLRKCLVETARAFKKGKDIERAVNFSRLNVPLEFDGPQDPEAIWNTGRFISKMSVGLRGSRVMRTRPQFFPWAMVVPGILVEDMMDPPELERILELAGVTQGIGDNRANGYGRFTAVMRVP